jgi:UDPglucose 6-dehydrogenase
MSKLTKNILCIGAGYVGGPTMAVIAQSCPNYKITVVDINQERIDAWNSPILPIYEPGLQDVVEECRGKNLFYSTAVEAEIKKADIIFVSVNTPTKTYGQGAGKAADLQFVEKTARMISQYAVKNQIVVEKSTLPVRTAEALESILHSSDSDLHFEVVSNPEFLAEGTAIQDLKEPDRVLIGGRQTELGLNAIQEIVKIYSHWVPAERILTTNTWSAELSKLVANAFLAQRVSSINTISALCEATEADVNEISKAIGMDSRIGSKFLKPSIGFGGSCFQKDILNLVYLCDHFHIPEAARYWEQVIIVNEWQKSRFVSLILSAMHNTIAGKKIAILGFAFKADTGDTRESPAIKIVRDLFEEKANIVIFDPAANENAKKDLENIASEISFVDNYQDAIQDADGLAILTDWQEFNDIDFMEIYQKMKKPVYLFDGRNLLDQGAMQKIGFKYYGIGR